MISAPFPDNQNGTELVIAVLARAKAVDAPAIGDLEVQVGGCVREVSAEPQAIAMRATGPELDPIVFEASETRYKCRRSVDQQLTPSPSEDSGPNQKRVVRFSDAEMVASDVCEHLPVTHLVTRYRFEVDHGFVPPDWREIERWTSATLTFGPPRCGLAPKNEIRARLLSHRPRAKTPAPGHVASGASRIVIELVRRAAQAAAASQPAVATQLAEQAIAAFGDGRAMADDSDADNPALADAVAGAYFYAVERDVDELLHRPAPSTFDTTWAAAIGADLDRIAARYQQIQDRVRLPSVTRWLRMGAMRLAELPLFLAKQLDAGGQLDAASRERAKARALAASTDTPGS